MERQWEVIWQNQAAKLLWDDGLYCVVPFGSEPEHADSLLTFNRDLAEGAYCALTRGGE